MKQQKRGKPFHKGQSGNPSGRPLGTRNKRTIALEKILDGEIEAITRKAVDAAKNGDMAAIRLIMDRVLPVSRSRPYLLICHRCRIFLVFLKPNRQSFKP